MSNSRPVRLYLWKPNEGGYIPLEKVYAVSRERETDSFPDEMYFNYIENPIKFTEFASIGDDDIVIEKKLFKKSGTNSKGEICYMEKRREHQNKSLVNLSTCNHEPKVEAFGTYVMKNNVVVLACEKCKGKALEMMKGHHTAVSIGYSLDYDDSEDRYVKTHPKDVVSVTLEKYHD